jgi:hypothetical protein
MMYMMFLAVVNASTFTIAVVKAPFALRRGGVATKPFVSFISYRANWTLRQL